MASPLKTLALVLPNNIPDIAIVIITNFLIPDISISQACNFGSVELLDFIWTNSFRDPQSSQWTVARLLQCENHYYQWEYSQALRQAVRREDRSVMEWVVSHFPGCPVHYSVVSEIAQRGYLWLLQRLHAEQQQGGLRRSDVALSAAAKSGHWDVVHWLIENTISIQDKYPSLVDIAIKANNLEEVKWLMARDYKIHQFDVSDFCEAEWSSRKEILRLVAKDAIWNAGFVLDEAVRHGDIRFSKWVVNHFYKEHGDIDRVFHHAKAASEHGCLSMLRWILKHTSRVVKGYDISVLLFAAAKNGKLDVVKWLCKKYGRKFTVDLLKGQINHDPSACVFAMDAAASGGHLEVLQFLHNLDISLQTKHKRRLVTLQHCTAQAMDSAAFNGHLDVVKWLHFNRSEGCTTAAMDKAAVNENLEMVKWLRLNRTEGCSSWALDMVASKSVHDKCPIEMAPSVYYDRQLEIIQWMHLNNAMSCTRAAMEGAGANGNLEMLKWLHSNTKVRYTHKAMDMAAKLGHWEVIKWLHEQNAPGTKCTTAAMDHASANGYLEVVEWLSSNRIEGCTVMAMDKAAGNGHLNVVKWLHINRSEGCTEAAMDAAAANGHLDVLKYLHANRSEGCSTAALDNAADFGHFKVVKWLFANRSEGCISTALAKAAAKGHLRVVRILVPRCTRNELFPAIRQAIKNDCFEVLLFLHAMFQKFHDNSTKLKDVLVATPSAMQISAAVIQGPISYGQDWEIGDWVHENFITVDVEMATFG